MKIMASIIVAAWLLSFDSGWAEPFRSLGFHLAEESKEEGYWEEGKGQDFQGLSKMVNLEKVIFTYLERSVETISLEGKDHYRITEKQKMVNEQILESTYLVAVGEYLKPVSCDYVRRNPEGRVLRSGTIMFDDDSWDYPDDVYPIPLLSVVFRSLLEHDLEENSFNLWLDDIAIIPMKVRVLGRERIAVFQEERDCRKMVMELDIQRLPFGVFGRFIIRLFKPWMPEFHFWFWENEPYPLLKFVSPGREDSPQHNSEVVEYASSFPPIRWVRTEAAEKEASYDGGQ